MDPPVLLLLLLLFFCFFGCGYGYKVLVSLEKGFGFSPLVCLAFRLGGVLSLRGRWRGENSPGVEFRIENGRKEGRLVVVDENEWKDWGKTRFRGFAVKRVLPSFLSSRCGLWAAGAALTRMRWLLSLSLSMRVCGDRSGLSALRQSKVSLAVRVSFFDLTVPNRTICNPRLQQL
jgi:hypothetical protein